MAGAKGTFGTDYLISVTLGNLDRLDKLYKYLVAIQTVSREGAEFNLSVNSTAMRTMRKTIATAVAEAMAAGFKASPSALKHGGSPPEGVIKQVLREAQTARSAEERSLEGQIKKLSEAVNRLSAAVAHGGAGGGKPPGDGGGGGTPAKAPRPQQPTGSGRKFWDTRAVDRLVEDALGSPEFQQKQAREKAFTEDKIWNDLQKEVKRAKLRHAAVRAFEDPTRAYRLGGSLGAEQLVEMLEVGREFASPAYVGKVIKMGDAARAKLNQFKSKKGKLGHSDYQELMQEATQIFAEEVARMGQILGDPNQAFGERLTVNKWRTGERLQQSRQHLLRHQSFLEQQGFSYEGTPIGRGPSFGPGGTLRLDTKSLEGKIDALIAALGNGLRVQGGDGGDNPLGNPVIRPDLTILEEKNRLLFGDAFPNQAPSVLGQTESGRKELDYWQSRGLRWAGHSLRMRQQIDSDIANEMRKQQAAEAQGDKKAAEYARQNLEALSDQRAIGGVYYYGERRDVKDGLQLSRYEQMLRYGRPAKTDDKGNILKPAIEANPEYAPTAPAPDGGRQQLRLYRQMKTEAVQLRDALKQIAAADMDPLRNAFSSIVTGIGAMNAQLRELMPLIDKIGGSEHRLNFEKRLQNQRLDYHRELQAIRTAGRAARAEEAPSVTAARERLIRGGAFSSTFAEVPQTQKQAEHLIRAISRAMGAAETQFVRMSRVSAEIQELKRLGLPTKAKSDALLRSEIGYNARVGQINEMMGALAGSPLMPAALQRSGTLSTFSAKSNMLLELRGLVGELEGEEASKLQLDERLEKVIGKKSSLRKDLNARAEAIDLGFQQREAAERIAALYARISALTGKRVGDEKELARVLREELSLLDRLRARGADEVNAYIRGGGPGGRGPGGRGPGGGGGDERTFFQRLQHRIGTVFEYGLASGMLYGGFSTLRTGVSRAMDYENQLAQIQGIFVNKTQSERRAVSRGILQSGQEYGVPLGQITGTAKIFAQTGASAEETLRLTRAALSATQGAGIDPQLATEMLIAVKEITNNKVDPLNIIDRISRIEAQNAVTAQDLAVAIQRVGSLAVQLQPQNIGGTDALDLIIGATTQVIEATRQNGQQASTGIKFIMSRLTAPDIQKQLQEDFGIKLASNKEGTGLRPLTDILQDIAQLYTQFRDSGQTKKAAELLSVAAGARQINTAAALFGGFAKVLDTARESAFSYGDAQRRLQIQLETLTSRVEVTGNSFGKFMNSLINEGVLGSILKGTVTTTGKVLSTASDIPGGAAFTAGATGFAALGLGKAILPRAVTSAIASGGAGAGAIVGATAGLVPIIASIATILLGLGIWSWVKAKIKGDEDLRKDLYGTQRVDPEQFAQSDLGKSFNERALSYGVLPGTLSRSVSSAADDAVIRTLMSRDASGRLRIPEGFDVFDAQSKVSNPKVYTTFVEEFTKALSEAIPSLNEIQNIPERQQEAMSLLQDTVRRGNVNLDFQVVHLQESLQNVGKTFRENLQKAVFAPGGFGLNVPASRAQLVFSSVLDNITKLPGQPQGFGKALSSLYIGHGKGTLQEEALKLINQGRSMGEALDLIADESFNASASGKLREAGVDRIARVMQPVIASLNEIETKRAEAARGLDNIFGRGSGAKFAQLLVDGYERAAQNIVADLRSTPTSVSAAKEFLTAIGRTGQREAFKSRIEDDINGANIRGFARDSILEQLLRYKTARDEIALTSDVSRRFGLGYDPDAEKAQAATTGLRGVIGAIASIDSQRLGALAKLQGTSVEAIRERFEDMDLGDDEGLKKLYTPEIRKAMFEAAENGRSRLTFANDVRRLTTAAEDIRENRDLFKSLSPEIREGIKKALLEGITSENFEFTAKAIVDALAQAAKLFEQVIEERARKVATTGFFFDSLASQTQSLGTRAQAQLNANVRIAELGGNQGAIFGAQQAAAAARRQTALQIAEIQRNRALTELAAEPGLSAEKSATRRQGIQYQFLSAQQDAQLRFMEEVTELVENVKVRYNELMTQQIESLRQPFVQGLSGLLQDYRNFSRRGLLAAMESISQTLQARVADVFADKLLGQNGIFGDQLAKILEQGMFTDQMTIQVANLRITNAAGQVVATGTGGVATPGTLGAGGGSGAQVAAVGGLVAAGAVGLKNLLIPSQIPSPGLYQTRNVDVKGVPEATATAKKADSLKERLKSLQDQALFLGASLGGAAIGRSTGVRGGNNYAQEGSTLGATIGSYLLPGVGTVLGGIAGGFLGGRIGKGDKNKEAPESATLERIEFNTRETVTALENGIRLRDLDNRLLNVPASFSIPAYNPAPGFSGGSAGRQGGVPMAVTMSNTFIINGGSNPRAVAQAITTELSGQLRNGGTFNSPRR